MSENLQERASEIIARAMELSPDEADAYIESACGTNSDLYELTMKLFEEVRADESDYSGEGQISPEGPARTKSRIGVGGHTTRVVGTITRVLFANKSNRLVTMLLFLAIIMALGFFIRYKYRQHVLEMEKLEQIAMLDINYQALQQWIDNKTRQTVEIAENPELIAIALELDSLVELDPGYRLLKEYRNLPQVYDRLNEIRIEWEAEAISIINKRDPVYMVLTEEARDGSNSAFPNLQLNDEAYKTYLQLKEENRSVFVAPMHDRDRFTEFPDNLHVGAYCSFIEPIRHEGQVIGYLYNEFNAKNDFSRILNLSHHNQTAETYAFNEEGYMISQSRFADELKNTYLLDFDSTREVIANIRLLDPGRNILKYKTPRIPQVDQPFTRIMSQVQIHLQENDSVFEGAIMKPYRDYRGIKVVGAWKYLPEYGFGLIDEIDTTEALLALRYFDGAFFLFLLILAGLTYLLYNANVRIANFGKRIEDFSKLGQYKLISKLGEGGFGEVYKAEHSFLKTPVAIKLLKKEFIGTDMLDRFEREVRVTSSLSHPNTIRVYDYGTSNTGQFYYVMEYLNGISLEKVVSISKEMELPRVVHVLLKVSHSLFEAHQKGLVHRDVKPMNIMLSNQGGAYDDIKLLDFGLVKNVDASISQQTQLNRIGGTPMFMAPERIRDPFNTDHRVDIYALGAVGLYMLSGQYLLELISQKMLSGQETLQNDFKHNLIERKDVPEELKNLLEKCVSFDPEKRPADLEEVIDMLENLQLSNPWTYSMARSWWKKYDVYG